MLKNKKTFYEVFSSFSAENPYELSHKLIGSLTHTCKYFGSLVSLAYTEIANEMFDAVIDSNSNQRIRDNMRYLVTILDKYIESTEGKNLEHPTISEEQAVWMVIYEKTALLSEKITNIVNHIPESQSSFKILAAKHLIHLNRHFSESTVRYRRNAIMKFENVYEKPVLDICENELKVIFETMPEYLKNHYKAIVNDLFPCQHKKTNLSSEQHDKDSISIFAYEQPASGQDTTLQELYEIWIREFSHLFSQKKLGTLKTGWKVLKPLWNSSIRSINILEIQDLISGLPSSTQQATKQMFKKLEHLANGMDIIDTENANNIVVDEYTNYRKRSILEDQDIQNLKLHKGKWYVDITLVLYYTGLRASELCMLKKTDVNLELMTLTGGSKTRWGIHRVIPIHKEIEPIIRKWVAEEDSEWLICKKAGKQFSPYDVEEAVKMATSAYCSKPHIPHECRHTFYTKLQQGDKNSASCISKLMGHSPFALPVGVRVYSHPSPDMLRNAINSLQ